MNGLAGMAGMLPDFTPRDVSPRLLSRSYQSCQLII